MGISYGIRAVSVKNYENMYQVSRIAVLNHGSGIQERERHKVLEGTTVRNVEVFAGKDVMNKLNSPK
jgi:hypothetical protein